MVKELRMRVPEEFELFVRKMMARDPFKTRRQCLKEIAGAYDKKKGL